MAIVVPLDIAHEIIHYVNEERLKLPRSRGRGRLRTLLDLRATARVFTIAVNAILFRKLEVYAISAESSARIKALCYSPSICASIKEYHFAPSRSYDASHPTWFPTEDEQKWVEQYTKRLMAVLRQGRTNEGRWKAFIKRPVKPQMVSRVESDIMLFSRILHLHNLTTLHITPFVVRYDISASLGILLTSSSLTQLEHLVLLDTTSEDMRVMQRSMIKRVQGSQIRHNIKSLQIRLVRDDREIWIPRDRVEAVLHRTDGKHLANFLQQFSALEQLNLLYYRDYSQVRIYLVPEDFDPPSLKRLSSLWIRGLVLRPSALLKLTVGDESSELIGLQVLRVTNVAIFSKEEAWSPLLLAWAKKLETLKQRFSCKHFDWCQNDPKNMWYWDEESGLMDMHYWNFGTGLESASTQDIRTLEKTFGIQQAVEEFP